MEEDPIEEGAIDDMGSPEIGEGSIVPPDIIDPMDEGGPSIEDDMMDIPTPP